jgi:hypothetical protein
MTRLSWGAPGERIYEAGLDRGVLFIAGLDGVAWTGLTAVNEESSGGEVTSYYMDGVKFLQNAASTEFEATISAFYSPPEFAQCEGSKSLANGLSISHQPKVPFSLSYRTGLGNDLLGLDYGYKIHLVYNALAEAPSKTHSTVSDSVSVSPLSWKIHTLPPAITGYKPTAHLIFDSTESSPSVIQAV